MEFPALKFDPAPLRLECDDPFACSHSEKDLRRKIDKLGKSRLHYQCRRCGQAVGNRVSAKSYSSEKIAALDLFDDALLSRVWKEFHARFEARQKKERERLKSVWKECYARAHEEEG
jgi:hypothetical protein